MITYNGHIFNRNYERVHIVHIFLCTIALNMCFYLFLSFKTIAWHFEVQLGTIIQPTIMSALTGLRLLQKNVALNAATRFTNRSKRIPRRILYYSRFASQLNFLRWTDRSSIKKIVNDGDIDLDELDLDSPPTIHNGLKQKLNEKLSREQEPEKENHNEGDTHYTNSEFKSLFINQREFSENDYIYKHIHKRLDRFANIGKQLKTLPINSYILQLRLLTQKKSDAPNPDLSKSIEELLMEIRGLIKSMNQQELAILLSAIKNDDTEEFRSVKRMIDIELRWLLKKHVKTRLMDLDLWFYLADTFYECLMKSTFVHVLTNYLAKENEVTMSNQQFLHLLFLVILQRNHNGILSDYEERILQVLANASFEDIATICMAYFKTKTKILNYEIFRRIINLTAEHLPSIDPEQPGYCSIIKSLRYSRNSDCRENVLHLIMTLGTDTTSRIVLTSAYNAVHTVKLMESFRIYDASLLEHMAETMFREEDFRIKDIQYALTSLSNFAYNDLQLTPEMKRNFDMLSHDIVSESRNDIDKQFFHLMPILRAFSMFGYYNDELIDYVNKLLQDQRLVQLMSKVIEFDRSALLVHTATRVDSSSDKVLSSAEGFFNVISSRIDRDGNMGSVRQDSSIKHLNFILRNTQHKDYLVNSNVYRQISKALASSKELLDPIYKFNFQYTLAHQNYADLIISKDCREPGQFDETSLMPKKVPSDQKHCLIQLVREQDYVDGHHRLSGYKQLVKRLLTKLGYTVFSVDMEKPDVENLARKIKYKLNR